MLSTKGFVTNSITKKINILSHCQEPRTCTLKKNLNRNSLTHFRQCNQDPEKKKKMRKVPANTEKITVILNYVTFLRVLFSYFHTLVVL